MSYGSINILSKKATIKKINELVEMLNYKKYKNPNVPGLVNSYFWSDDSNYHSFTGVELNIYRENGIISVTTRSRVDRSYWDLQHQNKTIKLLKEYYGGTFTTDVGKNKYLQPDREPPSNIEAGLYLSRWEYHNAIIKLKFYMDCRNNKGDISTPEATGINYMDEINPQLLSNNFIVPYIVGAWEHYLKSSYIVLLKYANNRDRVFKNIRLTYADLNSVSLKEKTIEECVADKLSFQRPTKIVEHFKALTDDFDLYATLIVPRGSRTINYNIIIEKIIESRNNFVHTGKMDITISNTKIKKIINDFETAGNLIYSQFMQSYNFKHFDVTLFISRV